MKRILEGFRYDTDKAVLIGEMSNIGRGVDSITDFNYWFAGLYVTPKAKRYFLAGRGGPMTRWARSAGQNSSVGGEGIIPVSEEEAFRLAQEYLDPADVEQHFSDLVKDA